MPAGSKLTEFNKKVTQLKKLMTGLLTLTSMLANQAIAETYIYTGKNFTITTGQYSTASEPRVTGSITTSSPIPPNSIDFEIQTIMTSWSFSDGVQTITDAEGVFHPSFATKISTDGAGNITRANIWLGDSPIATELGAKNNIIQTSFSTNFDAGLVQASCTEVMQGICTGYSFGPDRGLIFAPPGAWTSTMPQREFSGTLPSGKTGNISFTTVDPNCTFSSDPQFLSVESVKPLPPDSVVPIDGLVQFSIDSCADGATVKISVDYAVALPADAEYWKVGDPWFKLESTTVGSVISVLITDGKIGDDDGESNGQIVDPGGASIADIFSDGFESE